MGKFVQSVEQAGIIKRVEPTRNNDVGRAMAGGLNKAFEASTRIPFTSPSQERKVQRTVGKAIGALGSADPEGTSARRKTLLGR
jgi:hypothetical protein